MTKTLIAATLIAALGGFVATGPAHADALNGDTQPTIEYFHNGRSAPPAADPVVTDASPSAMPALNADLGTDDYLSKSHGRP